jgi:hypothetical protein
MGQTALLPLRRKAQWGFFHLKNLMALAGFEHVILGTRGQHANHLTTEAAMCTVCDSTNINTIIQFVPNCLYHVSQSIAAVNAGLQILWRVGGNGNFYIHRCNCTLLYQVYWVWQVWPFSCRRPIYRLLLLGRKVPWADISAQAYTIIKIVITEHNCNNYVDPSRDMWEFYSQQLIHF